MKKFGKIKKFVALISALTFACCSCGQSGSIGTTDVTTSATTQGGSETTGINIPAPMMNDYLRIGNQTVFYGNVMIDGKIETKIMRVATLLAENILNQTITYIDVIDDDGTILASTMTSGYGFWAVSTGENTTTTILRYSIDLSDDVFTLTTTKGEFANIGSDGKPNDNLSFVTHTNKNIVVTNSDDGFIFAKDDLETFSHESADFIHESADLIEEDADKWNVIAVSGNSKGISYSGTYGLGFSSYNISEMIPQIRSLNGETLKKIAADHFKMEEVKEDLAEKSEKMLAAILTDDFNGACDMMANFTPADSANAKKEFLEFQSILEGVESFKLENYYSGKYSFDSENLYSCCFMMTTNKGVFIVEIMQEVCAEKLLSFIVSKDIYNIYG